MKRIVIKAAMILTMSVSLALPVYGQNTDFTASFMECAQIENAPKRYACFDNVAKAVTASLGADDNVFAKTVVKNSEDVVSDSVPLPEGPQANASISEQNDDFGFKAKVVNEADFGLPQQDEKKQEITQIDAGIRDYSFSHTGHLTVLLDNGQIWRQLSGDRVKIQDYRMKRQTKAVISVGAFSSHRMTLFPSQKSLRVQRKK